MSDQQNIDNLMKLVIADHREAAAADMRERAAKLLNKEADLIGAVDGYDYKSGEEAGLRRGARLVGSLPLDPDSATGEKTDG